jgi:hypothetical protein
MTSEEIVSLNHSTTKENDHTLSSNNNSQNVPLNTTNIRHGDIVENEVESRDVYLSFILQQSK